MEAQHLLVVDDDAGIRDVVRAYAARDGYRVTEAADGHEAQRVVDQHMVAIRRALATAGSASRVESVRGIGYRLVPGQP